ncbi:MAG: hypothetical protein JXA92_10375 [candidate division Zixibacteria bacterium]|nr:hypothetical protein [candidate division Zixibacteria bacterium]
MLKKIIYVSSLGALVGLGGVYTLNRVIPLGPAVLALTAVPLLGLFFARRSFKGAVPDLVFGMLDTGLLAAFALSGGVWFGVAGAIAGSAIGDALTDGIAGFFEGGIAQWLRKRGIEEAREPLTTALGKMAGCLFGSGLVLTVAFLFGLRVNLI